MRDTFYKCPLTYVKSAEVSASMQALGHEAIVFIMNQVSYFEYLKWLFIISHVCSLLWGLFFSPCKLNSQFCIVLKCRSVLHFIIWPVGYLCRHPCTSCINLCKPKRRAKGQLLSKTEWWLLFSLFCFE